MSAEALLAAPDVELVLNLTTPDAHAPIAQAALEAGKGVYNEKPLAIALADGARLVADGAGSAGSGWAPRRTPFSARACRPAARRSTTGLIGEPVAATAFMLNHGHEGWHPQPDFYYQPGGGPLFDMGPYYLTALVGAPRAGPPRHRVGPRLVPRAHDPQRAARRRAHPGRGGDAPGRGSRLRRRRRSPPW